MLYTSPVFTLLLLLLCEKKSRIHSNTDVRLKDAGKEKLMTVCYFRDYGEFVNRKVDATGW